MKFKDSVLKIVANIPSGQTMTYKEVAEKAGSPKAYRAVGNILNKYYKDNFSQYYSFPCHRVIRSSGNYGNYAGGSSQKEKLLLKEKSQLKCTEI
jgi:O-6-methylguanine DNA methyltransferase